MSHFGMLCLNLCSEKACGSSVCLRIGRTFLQPLGGFLLKPFKIFYQHETTAFSYNKTNVFITKFDLGKLFESAENKVARYNKDFSTHVQGGS